MNAPVGRLAARSGMIRADPHQALLAQVMMLAGNGARLLQSGVTPWASATFVGARHRLTLVMTGRDAMARARTLAKAAPDHEFAMAGHFVADFGVEAMREALDARDEVEVVMDMLALTVEEW